MVYRFKLYGQRYMIDTGSCTLHELSELQYDMLSYLKLPFEDQFPSSLRYDLAKYESSQLAQAYMTFRKWHFDGVFLSEAPLKPEETKVCLEKTENTTVFGERKFVFASDVIKMADSGCDKVSAEEDANSPVKTSDYDILEAEYERVAKEIIKRKTGRIPGNVFKFIPFEIVIKTDEKGYMHLANEGAGKIFETEGFSIAKKCLECGIAVELAK